MRELPNDILELTDEDVGDYPTSWNLGGDYEGVSYDGDKHILKLEYKSVYFDDVQEVCIASVKYYLSMYVEMDEYFDAGMDSVCLSFMQSLQENPDEDKPPPEIGRYTIGFILDNKEMFIPSIEIMHGCAAIDSTATGDFDVGATWVGGTKPGTGDTFTVKAGHTVTIDGTTELCVGFTVENTATLRFDTNGDSAAAILNIENGGTIENDGTIDQANTDATYYASIAGVSAEIYNSTSTNMITFGNGYWKFSQLDFQKDITTGGSGCTFEFIGDCTIDAITVTANDTLLVNGVGGLAITGDLAKRIDLLGIIDFTGANGNNMTLSCDRIWIKSGGEVNIQYVSITVDMYALHIEDNTTMTQVDNCVITSTSRAAIFVGDNGGTHVITNSTITGTIVGGSYYQQDIYISNNIGAEPFGRIVLDNCDNDGVGGTILVGIGREGGYLISKDSSSNFTIYGIIASSEITVPAGYRAANVTGNLQTKQADAYSSSFNTSYTLGAAMANVDAVTVDASTTFAIAGNNATCSAGITNPGTLTSTGGDISCTTFTSSGTFTNTTAECLITSTSNVTISGTYTHGNLTKNSMSGTSALNFSVAIYNLDITADTTTLTTNSSTVVGTLDIGGTLTDATNNLGLAVTGVTTITGTLTFGTGTIAVADSFNSSSGTFTYGTSTLQFTDTATLTVGGTGVDFYNITVDATKTVSIAGGTFNTYNVLTVNGTLDTTSYNARLYGSNATPFVLGGAGDVSDGHFIYSVLTDYNIVGTTYDRLNLEARGAARTGTLGAALIVTDLFWMCSESGQTYLSTCNTGNFNITTLEMSVGIGIVLGKLICGSSTIDIGADGLLIQSGSEIDADTSTIQCAGDLTTTGTFTYDTSTVDMDGAVAQVLDADGSTFYDLDISNTANTVSLGLACTVAHDLTIDASATLDTTATDYALTVTGDTDITGILTGNASAISTGSLTINSGGTYSATSGTTTINSETSGGYAYDNDGTLTNNSGTFTITTPAATKMDSAGTSGNLYNLILNHASLDITINEPVTVLIDNDLTITAGILNTDSGAGAVNMTVTGNVSITGTLDAANFSVSVIIMGSLAITATGTYLATGGTTTVTNEAAVYAVDIDGTYTHNDGLLLITTAAGTILDLVGTGNVYDLEVQGGNKLWQGSTTIDHDLTVTSGKFAPNAGYEADDLTVTGDVIVAGTLGDGDESGAYALGSLTFSGTVDATSATTTITSKDGSDNAWNNNGGTFVNHSGTVDFTYQGGATAQILGDNSWSTIEVTINAASTYKFGGNSTQTVATYCRINGSSGQLIILDSTDVNDWNLTLSVGATQDFAYLDIDQSNASGGLACEAAFSTDQGTNTNWTFGAAGQFVWDGGGADENATTNNNWAGNVAPSTISDAQFGAASDKNCTWDLGSTVGHVDITGDYSGTVSLGVNVVWSSLDVLGGSMSVSTYTQWVTGQVVVNGGDITLTTGTLTYDDTLTITNNIVLPSAGASITVGSDVTINNGGTLGASVNYTPIFQSIEINSGGEFSASTATTSITGETVGGYAFDNDGTLSANNGNITFSYAGTTLIDANGTGNLYDVTLNHGNLVLTLSATMIIGNNLVVSMGELNTGSNNALTVSGTTTLTDTINCNASTVVFTGTLTLGAAGTFTLASGAMNSSDVNFDVGTYSLTGSTITGSNNSGAVTIDASNATDGGGNTGDWNFGGGAVSNGSPFSYFKDEFSGGF